jgi:acyl-coenzyme A thioesterase PaaI-like protein
MSDLGVNTHLGIDRSLCGTVTARDEGRATVVLDTTAVMGADAQGLVHGGFVFGAADYAAMVAVNDPFVVLGAADTRFLAPVQVGQTVRLEATVSETRRRKRIVDVVARVGEDEVFTGRFTTFVLDAHVLAGKG